MPPIDTHRGNLALGAVPSTLVDWDGHSQIPEIQNLKADQRLYIFGHGNEDGTKSQELRVRSWRTRWRRMQSSARMCSSSAWLAASHARRRPAWARRRQELG